MPKQRSMSGSVSQLHVRLPGRLSRGSLPSQHRRVYQQFVRQRPMSGRCGQLHLPMSNWMDRISKFRLLKMFENKFFNFWLVISDVMRISTNANRILVRTTRRAIIYRPLLLQLYRRFRRRRLREAARRHLRQRALPQQRQLHGSLRRIDFAGQQLHLPLSVWLWWNQLRESHQLLFRSRSLS